MAESKIVTKRNELQMHSLHALAQLHDELFTRLYPLLPATCLKKDDYKEYIRSERFEDVGKMFILDRLYAYSRGKNLLNLQTWVAPHSRPTEAEREWLSLKTPALPRESCDELIFSIEKSDYHPAHHIARINYNNLSCWAKIQEITSTTGEKNSGRLGFLIAICKTKRTLDQFESALQDLSGELVAAMHMLRHAGDRVMMAYLSSIISETGEQEEILRRISSLLASHLRSDGLKINVLRNTATGVRYQKMFRTDILDDEPEYFKLNEEKGLTDWVLLNNDWLLIDNPSPNPGEIEDRGFSGKVDEVAIKARKESKGTDKALDEEKTLFLYPLRILGRIVGVLSIWRRTPDLYDRRLDLSTLQYITPVVASGLKWQVKQEHSKRKSIELAGLINSLVHRDSFKSVYKDFVSCVGRLANAARTILFLDDKKSKVLCALANWSAGQEETNSWKEFLVSYRDRKEWRTRAKRAIMERDELCRCGNDKLVVADVLELASKGFSGVVAILESERDSDEKVFTLFEDQITRPILESFIRETGPLMANSVETFSQRGAQRFIETADSPYAHETPVELLQRTANHLREQTQCDAVLVYHYTSKGLEVNVTSPLREPLHNMGYSRNSYTHKTVQKKKTIRIIDVTRGSGAHIDKMDNVTLRKVKESFGWEEIRSWLCVPVVIDNRVVGLLKLLTSRDGIFLGPCHEIMVETLATRVQSKMQQIRQRVMLEELNDISEKLVLKEDTELSKGMLEKMQKWSEDYIRSNTQIAIFATIATPLPRLFTHSSTMSKDLRIELETIAEERKEVAEQIKIKNMHCLSAPIGIAGSKALAGFLFIIGKQKFSDLALTFAKEAARELAVILDRERRRIEWIRKVGRFRHAVIGPFQGLASSARMLHVLAQEKDPDLKRLRDLRTNMEKEIESIRLWRENQRLYTGGVVQVIKRLYSLEETINKCVQRFEAVLLKRNIKLRVEWNGNEKLHFFFDREGLDLAISNLLDNAQKYAFRKTEVILGIMHHKEADIVEIWVEDIGHPIPHQLDEILYDAGTRLDWEDPQRSIHGTGLGLPMTQKIIQRHGGNIKHASVPKGKTNIEPHFPLGNEKDDTISQRWPLKEESVSPHRVRFTIEIPCGV